MTQQTTSKVKSTLSPLITPEDRVAVWEKARGMWRHRKPDPIAELKTMRQGWKRELPPLK